MFFPQHNLRSVYSLRVVDEHVLIAVSQGALRVHSLWLWYHTTVNCVSAFDVRILETFCSSRASLDLNPLKFDTVRFTETSHTKAKVHKEKIPSCFKTDEHPMQLSISQRCIVTLWFALMACGMLTLHESTLCVVRLFLRQLQNSALSQADWMSVQVLFVCVLSSSYIPMYCMK
jgi:hypothetical protein